MAITRTTRDSAVEEREAIEELIQSDGWAYFVEHAHTEWAGAGFVSRIGAAVGKGEGAQARIVYETHLNILRMLQWPSDRLKELGAEVEE